MSDSDNAETFRRAVMLVWDNGKASTSFIQRGLGIGYNAAARHIERMEALGVVTKPNHVGKREVRSADDLRKAMNIRDEVIAIAGGDAEQAALILNGLVEGMKVLDPSLVGVDLATGPDQTVVAERIGEQLLASATMTVATADGSVTMPFDAELLTASIHARLDGKPLTRKQVEAMTTKKTDPDAPEFPVTKEHNYGVTADELRQFIERFEQLDVEKKDVNEQQKELMAEAKGRGYDTKVMKKIVALRKRKPDDIAEEEAIIDMYKAALGMA